MLDLLNRMPQRQQTNSTRAQPGKPWTTGEDRQLRALTGTMSVEDLAKRLGRSVRSVQGHAYALGINLGYRARIWTGEDLMFVAEHAGRQPVPWIANRLNRSVGAVKAFIVTNGIDTDPHFHKAKAETRRILKEAGFTDYQIRGVLRS